MNVKSWRYSCMESGALASSSAIGVIPFLRVAAGPKSRKECREANGNDKCEQCACRNHGRCISRPEQCSRSKAGGDGRFFSGRGRCRRDFAKSSSWNAAARLATRNGCAGSEQQCGRSRTEFDYGSNSDRARWPREFGKAGSRYAPQYAVWKGGIMTRVRMKGWATIEPELKNTAGRGASCFPVIIRWPFFAWHGGLGLRFWSTDPDVDGKRWELSGLIRLGHGFLRELATGNQLGRNVCWALANVTALCVFGAVVQTPSSLAATLVDSSAVTRTVELPPVPTEFPPLRDIAPLAYEQLLLPNGLRLFLLEDHELGLVGGELLVKGGGKGEPSNKVGLAALSAIVQRSGGSIAHPAEDLDSKLDAMAARIETSSSVSEMSVGFRCLTEDLPVVFSLFSEVVQEPLMPEKKLELARSQFGGIIARRADDAGGVVAREFNKLLYGKESVYSRLAELPTLKAVDRDDLLEFHSKNFRPDKGVLGIWGDFDASAVKKLVEEQFGAWIPAPQEVTPISASVTILSASESGCSVSPPSVYIIDRPGLTQGYVRMGEFGTTLADPDVFALDVLNGILNGFGGLLFDEVRSREGLAYSVSGGWSPAVEHRGSFIAGGETRVQALPQFVQAVKRVLDNVTSEPPDADLLARAKEKALNSFVFNFADSGSQLARVMSYELFGIDQDFLFKYKEGVETTTALDVMEAAQRHLHPDLQPVLIVTDAQQLKSLLPGFTQPVVPLNIDYMSQSESAKVE